MNKKTVILADNSYTIRRIAELSFSDEEDIKLVTFETGEGFKEKLIELKPSIVLVDIKFPDFNGYEVCKFVNEEDSLKDTKVFLIRGGFEAIDDEKIKDLNYVDIITKPFDSTALIDTIKSNLGLTKKDTLGEDELADSMPEELPEINEISSPEEDISFSDIQDEIDSTGMDFGDDKEDSKAELEDDVEPSEEITVQQQEGQDRLKPEVKDKMENPFDKESLDSAKVDFAGVADELKKIKSESDKDELPSDDIKEEISQEEKQQETPVPEVKAEDLPLKEEDIDEKFDLQIDPAVQEDIEIEEDEEEDTFDAEEEAESALDEPKEEEVMPGVINIGPDQSEEKVEESAVGDIDFPASLDEIIEDEKIKPGPELESEIPPPVEKIEIEETEKITMPQEKIEEEDSGEELDNIESIKKLEQMQKEEDVKLDEAGDFGKISFDDEAVSEEPEEGKETVLETDMAEEITDQEPKKAESLENINYEEDANDLPRSESGVKEETVKEAVDQSDPVFNKEVIMKKIEDKLEIAVKEILWEIIPPMAEKIITDEIDKIKSQVSEDSSD